MKFINKRLLNLVLGVIALGFMASMPAKADSNPFEAQQVVSSAGVDHEKGKCGEGKCGEGKAKAKGKCGEGKCGEGKAKAKCGEGKCGEGKKNKQSKEEETEK